MAGARNNNIANDRFRAAQRLQLERPAVLIDLLTKLKIGALVLDLSRTGASLELPPGIELPKTFQLHWDPIPGAPMLVLKSELVWQRGYRAGCRFRDLGPKTQHVLESFLSIRFSSK